MSADEKNVEEMTEREKIVTILKALKLPRGHYIVGGSGAMVLHGIERSRPIGDLDLFVTTALWFQMYETVEGGLIWGLYVPDPQSTVERCDPPYLYLTLMDVPINIFYDWRKRGFGEMNVAQDINNRVYTDDHWPTLPLPRVLELKEALNRAKDKADIKILREYLEITS